MVAALVPVGAAGGEIAGGVEVVEVLPRHVGDGGGSTVRYEVAVLEEAGWRLDEIERAIQASESIYAQCGVTLHAVAIHRLRAPPAYQLLEEEDQARLLSGLAAGRPLVLFVNRTAAGDTAYSYRRSAPVAERGTAWITRTAAPSCVGVLLAHELGHILLDTARHSRQADNLMSYTCTHNNLAGAAPAARLSKAQCRRLQGGPL